MDLDTDAIPHDAYQQTTLARKELSYKVFEGRTISSNDDQLYKTGPKVVKLFPCSNSAEHEIHPAHKC